ncbi:Glycosylphosphatidylinositol anchor attachment 1 protein, partial [Operophtera brumata]
KRIKKKTVKEDESDSDSPGDDVKCAQKEELSDTEVPGEQKQKVVKNDSSMSVVNIGANYLLVHLIGYGVMNTPALFTYIGSSLFNLPSELSVYYCLIASSVLLALITPFLPHLLRKSPLSREEMTLVNILLLIELATVCLSVGMHNFPLGLIIATIYTPLALVVDITLKTGKKT